MVWLDLGLNPNRPDHWRTLYQWAGVLSIVRFIYFCLFKFLIVGLICSVRQWSGRLGFNLRLSHTKNSRKWYLMPPCLTLSNKRYGSKVKLINLGKGVAPSSTPRCSKYWKGSLRVTLDDERQLIFILTS